MLVARGFLLLSNQEFDSSDSKSESKSDTNTTAVRSSTLNFQTLQSLGLVGERDGGKWWVGESFEEAFTGYPTKEALLDDLFVTCNPDVLFQLNALIQRKQNEPRT